MLSRAPSNVVANNGSELPQTAVVVVTHNRPVDLAKCISSIRTQSFQPHALLIVDNASSDPATAETIRSWEGVTWLRLDKNIGCSGGFARGIAAALEAGAHWILLLDDDVVLEPNVLESLSKAAAVAQPEVGALFTAVVENGRLATMHRRRFFADNLKEEPVSAGEYRDDLVAIDEGSFVGFFLRAKAANHVGLPVPEFFMAYDDTEYSLRLRQAGWKLFLVPRLRVYHRGGAGLRLRNTRYGLKHYYTLRNQLATLAEYGRAPMFRLALPICRHCCFAVATGGLNGFRLFLKAFRDAPEIRQHIRGASYNV